MSVVERASVESSHSGFKTLHVLCICQWKKSYCKEDGNFHYCYQIHVCLFFRMSHL